MSINSKNSTLPLLDLPRGKPRSYLEWKTLRRWDQLPSQERSTPGYLLKLAREETGLTQKELALRLNTSQQAIAQAERWQSNPTMSFMRSWMKACGKKLELGFR
jgi:DNA-binding XRE family transcriptional regulator